MRRVRRALAPAPRARRSRAALRATLAGPVDGLETDACLTADGRLVLGLPGNPASALVCAELFLRPLLMALPGADPALKLSTAELSRSLPANGGREHWMRARLATDQGRRIAEPMSDQDSSLVSVFAESGGLIRRAANAPAAEAGAAVDVLPLERL